MHTWGLMFPSIAKLPQMEHFFPKQKRVVV